MSGARRVRHPELLIERAVTRNDSCINRLGRHVLEQLKSIAAILIHMLHSNQRLLSPES